MSNPIIPSFDMFSNPAVAQSYGLLGDYFGGFWGTILTAFTLIVLLFSYKSSSKIDQRNKIYSIFSEMISSHEDIINSMRRGDYHGRQVISKSVSDLRRIMDIAEISEFVTNIELGINTRMDLAFTILMYGTSKTSDSHLSKFAPALIADLKTRLKNAKNNKDNPLELKGHHTIYSHYFRNLYAMHKFVDQSGIDDSDKIDLLKVIRAKLSTNEQVILAFNMCSHTGREWLSSGLLHKYKPIKNIPEWYFDSDGKGLKDAFPYITFEWEDAWNYPQDTIVLKMLGCTIAIHVGKAESPTAKIAQEICSALFKIFRKFC